MESISSKDRLLKDDLDTGFIGVSFVFCLILVLHFLFVLIDSYPSTSSYDLHLTLVEDPFSYLSPMTLL